MGDTIKISARDGSGDIPVYRAEPKRQPAAAVIVIQEIFGVNAGIRRKADDWAAKGYLTFAPDIFWRIEPGVDLDPDEPSDRERAFSLLGRFDLEAGMRDVEAVIRTARDAVAGGKVGLVGFCLGGRIAYLAATRTDIDVSVGYYGGGIDKALGEANATAKPLMLHFGEKDSHIPQEAIATIRDALAGRQGISIHSYAGAGHGFATEFGRRRNEEAARQADARTEALLAEALA